MPLRTKVVVIRKDIVNSILNYVPVDYAFEPNVKRIKGFHISASCTGATGNTVCGAFLNLNNNNIPFFQGDVQSPDMATFKGQFKWDEVENDLVPNAVVTGKIFNKTPNVAVGATYRVHIYFQVEEEYGN
jgi:hypothetical protein